MNYIVALSLLLLLIGAAYCQKSQTFCHNLILETNIQVNARPNFREPVVDARINLAKQMNLPISHFSPPECYNTVMKCLQKLRKKGNADPIQCCEQCS